MSKSIVIVITQNISHIPQVFNTCLHITPYELEFSQQAIDLGWRMTSETAAASNQVLSVHRVYVYI